MSDSYNHVFKQNVHSHHRELISGGSSGGEGALVGCLGSIVGFGTDTGGSVRIPSNMQGCYGLAPTVGRLSFADSARARRFIAPPVTGPITSSIETMECVLKAYLAAQPWRRDPVVYPIPWRSEVADSSRFNLTTTNGNSSTGRKLRIGYFVDDGVVLPQPPITAAVLRVVDLLRAAGHSVFEWTTTEHGELHSAWGKAIMSDGGKYARDSCALSGEPLIEGMIVGTDADLLSQEQAEALADLRVDHQRRYMQRWDDAQVDALITPAQTFTGMRTRVWVHSDQHVGYTCVWNWLGFAGLVVPVGVIDEENARGDENWTRHQVRNKSDKFNYEICKSHLSPYSEVTKPSRHILIMEQMSHHWSWACLWVARLSAVGSARNRVSRWPRLWPSYSRRTTRRKRHEGDKSASSKSNQDNYSAHDN